MEFPIPLPTTPLSNNVVPLSFEDYVAARKGVGHPAVLTLFATYGAYKIKPHRGSRGLIWNNRPYWWSEKGYYRRGKSDGPRHPLQHEIWEHQTGKKIPRLHEIFFRDRNRNNFAPENLQLLHKSEMHKLLTQIGEVPQPTLEDRKKIAGKRWMRHARNITDLLLKRSQQTGGKHDVINSLKNRKAV